MSREALLSMTRREVENFQRRRIDLAPDIYRVPTRLYSDADRFQLEVDRIFKRLPLSLGFSCELREPGDYRALTVAGVPVLIVRGEDKQVRAFVNMCSHRGNFVVEEGSGKAKNFRCNYHAWSYDLRGDLVNIFDESNFGTFDKSCNGLTPLPVAERAGLLWVTLDPKSPLEIDDFLSGYDEIMAHLRFEDTFLAGRQYLNGPNWKVAYDGYRDFYHVPILHRETFGPDGPFQPDFYAWGPHVRVTSPKGHDAFFDRDEADWSADEMASGVWTIFPNVSIAGSPATGGFMVSQMYPGEQVGESFTIQNFLRFGTPEDVDQKELEQHMHFMRRVVQDEDYGTGLNVQKALATGAKEYSYFGRNEGGGQLFHRWVDALVEAEDADLPALLRNGVSWHDSESSLR